VKSAGFGDSPHAIRSKRSGEIFLSDSIENIKAIEAFCQKVSRFRGWFFMRLNIFFDGFSEINPKKIMRDF